MRISDWSSDVCSSDLPLVEAPAAKPAPFELPPVDAKYSTTPSSVDRSKGVPKVDTFPELDFPDLQHATLANGSKLILAERHEIPVVQMRYLFDGGYASEDRKSTRLNSSH